MSRGIVFIILCITLLTQPIKGNGDVFQNIGEAEGLSQRWIRSIYQDRYGFMWFGTKDGLNRYDGIEFRHYRYNPGGKNLASSTINYITEDLSGNLWICNNLGVSIYDRDMDQFNEFPYLPHVIVEHVVQSDSSTFWFATSSGLYRYNSINHTVEVFQHKLNDPKSLCSDLLTCLLVDNQKNIWIGTKAGLCVFNTTTAEFTQLRIGAIANPYIFDIVMDSRGRIWISEYDNGLFVHDSSTEIYTDDVFNLVVPGLTRVLMIDKNNHLWVSWGQKQGVISYNLNYFNSSRKIFEPQGIGKRYLDRFSIDAIYSDRLRNTWFGTFDKGLFYRSNDAKKFYIVSEKYQQEYILSSYIINVFLEDGDYLWIGTEFGLNRCHIPTGDVKYFQYSAENPRSIGSNAIYAITKDSDGKLWIGTWNGGLNLYNPVTQDFTRYKHNPEDKNSLISNNVFSITEIKPGVLLVGTISGGGLVQFDIKHKQFTDLSHNLFKDGAPKNNSVSTILKASNGIIWISSYTALHIYDPKTDGYRWYAHSADDSTSLTVGDIEVIFEDSKKNIWVGTEGGLNYFRPGTNNFGHYTTADGLSSNYINSISEDESNNLWIGTNYGLIKFMNGTSIPSHPQFECYTTEDGLPSREFIKRSTYFDHDKHMYFGGINGYVYFYPDSIVQNPTPPQILLTDLYVLNEHVTPGISGSVLEKEIYLIKELKLDYDQNIFTIHFAALNYLTPQKNNYAYMLEGFDKKWIMAGNKAQAVYTNIDPGRYVFHVKASNNDGVWDETGISLPIIISPPWWKTLIAQIGFILALMFMLVLIYKNRVKAITRQKNLLENMVHERTRELTEVNTILEETKEEVSMQNEELLQHRQNLEQLVTERTEKLQQALEKAKEADRLKSSFLANMSHEIRTPMNAIVGFAALLNEEETDPESREKYITIINSNTQSLLVLIDDILEISLIEANQIVLDNQLFYIDTIFNELEDTYKLRNEKNLSIEFIRNDAKKVQLFNDPVRLNQCLANLINNAIKFTEHGFVKFGYYTKEDEIICYVTDSGIGIDKSEINNIFNQFYKVEKNINQLYRGTGLGLAITEKLVKLMNGSIWVESEPGVGSTFNISLPFVESVKIDNIQKKHAKLYSYDLKKTHILIVEDEPANYLLIEEILKKTGAKTDVVINGLQAVQFVKQHAEATNLLVLMDIKMPVMDGLVALNEIRKAGIEIPIIAITAYARKNEKQKFLKAGFTDYLSKPLNPNLLLETIQRNIVHS